MFESKDKSLHTKNDTEQSWEQQYYIGISNNDVYDYI